MISVSVENLKTYFFLGSYILKAVNGVTFKIDEGESLAIVGESGSGKSVTCRSILGIQNPGKIVEGKVHFKNINLLELSYKEIRKIRGNQISIIFQNPATSLNPLSTIGGQIEDQVFAHRNWTQKDAKERILESFAHVGISDGQEYYNKYPCELSNATIQQIMVAASIVNDPKIIIADEPTSNLGTIGQANVLNSLIDVKENSNASILLVTHNLGVAAQLAENILVMYGGRIVEYGSANIVLKSPKHPYTKGLINSVLEVDSSYSSTLFAIPGDPVDLFDAPQGCAFYPRCGEHIDICKANKPVLVETDVNRHCACFLYK